MRRGWLAAIGALAVAGATAGTAEAQLNRSAVSVAGDDANNCAPATPCRSFARAMSQTNAGGEVIVLDSGGYGPFTIDKAITVQAAPGVYAGVTATTGHGIHVAAGASDVVVIRGLSINGMGTGSVGIAGVTGGKEIHVEKCQIQGFADWGILTFIDTRISDTTILNSKVAIRVDNAGAPVKATIERSTLAVNSVSGLEVWRNAVVTARDTLATKNGNVGFDASFNGVLVLENALSTRNLNGVRAFNTQSVVRLSNSLITENSTGIWNGGTVQTFVNNKVRGNGTDVSGTAALTTATQN
jgi:hypothetical protein